MVQNTQHASDHVSVEIENDKPERMAWLIQGFIRVVLATASHAAVTACNRMVESTRNAAPQTVEVQTWLDIA